MTAAAVLPDSGLNILDSRVGIDTISLIGPTDPFAYNELQFVSHIQGVDPDTGELMELKPRGVAYVEAGQTRARVAFQVNRLGHPTVRMEVSAPKMLYGHNWDGVPVDQVDLAVDALVSSVAEALPYVDVPEIDEVIIRRLDLTRDFFGLRNPSSTLAAIATNRPSRAKADHLHYRHDGQLQTLTRGTKTAWLVRGYDKVYEQLHTGSASSRAAALLMAAVRPCQLRVEIELKQRELNKRGLLTVGDLLAEDLTGLARHYFERSHFDVNTGQEGLGDLVELLRLDGASPAHIRNLIVYLTGEQYGVPTLLGRDQHRQARALANRYRITGESLGESTLTRRLDFDSGVEVVA